MIILIANRYEQVKNLAGKHVGRLVTPRLCDRMSETAEAMTWAADNDAFSSWDPDRYRRMLEQIYGLPGCLFVTAPDVVGDANRTLELFEEWYDELNAVWQPLAMVAQDGLTPEMVPWRRINAIFVGGSTQFKLGADAEAVVQEGRRLGKWIHMGRVNGPGRIAYAKSIGCDSLDGMTFSRYYKTWLAAGRGMAAAPPQLRITDAS